MSLSKALLAHGAVLTALMLFAAAAHADEFGAMPGLWKMTLQTQSAAGSSKPQVEWHCVDEDADPWIDFARLPEAPVAGCARTAFERTGTTLKWQMSCNAPGTVTSDGNIVFDAPQHYSGNVTVDGNLLGFPLHGVTLVSGERVAACTSPKD